MSAVKLNKSMSDPNIDDRDMECTPPNFTALRNKRRREEDLPTEFCEFKEYMKELFNSFMATQQKELKEISNNLKELQLTNNNIETSIQRLSTQHDEFQKRIESLELQVKKDRDYINVLEGKIEDLQRDNRKSCIEIKNVPKTARETQDDLINMVLCLAKNINLDLVPRDIKDIHRIQGRKVGVKNTPIIIELASSILKTDLLQKTKLYNIKNKTKLQAKHLGCTSNGDTPVFISEQLTAKGARLHFLARDLVKMKKYKYCWTKFGQVYVKQDENTQGILINNEAQVHHLQQAM